MSEAERQRWGEEMRADVARVRRGVRLLYAFGLWRKGAPAMPVGPQATPRPAAADSRPQPPDASDR